MEEVDLFQGFLRSIEDWHCRFLLILTNEEQMCIIIISCMVLHKFIKLKARRMLFLSYNPLTE